MGQSLKRTILQIFLTIVRNLQTSPRTTLPLPGIITLKMAVLWVVAPCILVIRADDGGSKDL
jgi:hypothetical protein